MAQRRGVPVCLAAFDLLELDDEPIIHRRYEDRRALLVDLVPPEDWAPKEPEMTAVFVDFLKRAQAKAA